ncbi:hypothetical protein [Microbispora sp. H10830]|uniref:hypothetical protein n=1 Tax=Microbispora sp. H10830 TaxID=2729109 RepID=UPI001600B184|nr:hypothetical protein [Microbispora sp. H10830]
MVGRSLLDQVLTDTETLDESIEQILDRITQQWGVHVLLVERAVRALSQFEGAEGAKVEPATRSTVRIDPGGVEVF